MSTKIANNPLRIKKILKWKQPSAEKLLDIGCGDGKFSLMLKEAFEANEVYGIEIAAQPAEIAWSKGIKTTSVDLNEADFPFDDDSFDMVFAGEIIEHLISPDYFLDEIYRVLRPGGYCIITTPNLASWHGRSLLLLGYQPYTILASVIHREVGTFLSRARKIPAKGVKYISPSGRAGMGHIQFFTLGAIKDLLKVHGFQIMRVSGAPVDRITFSMPFLLRKIVMLIDRVTSSLFPSLASTTIIMAKRP